jgi:hypothetical protein
MDFAEYIKQMRDTHNARIAAIKEAHEDALINLVETKPSLPCGPLSPLLTPMMLKKDLEKNLGSLYSAKLRYPEDKDSIMDEIQSLEEHLDMVNEYIDDLEKHNAKVEETNAEFEQAISHAEDDWHDLKYLIADWVGIDNLRMMRNHTDGWMDFYNKIQHEAYKAQKQRYETCKRKTGFKAGDRDFINLHKEVNQDMIDKWINLSYYRDSLCELIEMLDPSDPDLGTDYIAAA